MKKDVLVLISGLQLEEGLQAEPIEVMTAGMYFYRNHSHYIVYEEIDDEGQISKNRIKISEDANRVEIVKKGLASTQMTFECGKENLMYYDTPYGSFLMGTQTSKIEFRQIGDSIMELEISYVLSVDSRYVSDCEISVKITSK